MAKRRTSLPKDFDGLLIKSSLQELKDVFAKCDVNARGGYSKQACLAYENCPDELAKWLVQHGADLQATDAWGNTPLHNRARSIFGNIASLLDLGADVNYNNRTVGTPLHSAADSHNVENTVLLLKFGARVDELNLAGYTPLEQGLQTCRNIDIINTKELSKTYINSGIQITSRMRQFVIDIGQQFEFHKANFHKESVLEVSHALDDLYTIFGVEPVSKRFLHNGQSSITVNPGIWQNQFEFLWDLLVPSSGTSETIQGEIIRISGRIANELDGNGGINWDNDYEKMADSLVAFTKQGKPLTFSDQAEVKEIVKEIKKKAGSPARLCEFAVKWVIDNPTPLKLSFVDYKR